MCSQRSVLLLWLVVAVVASLVNGDKYHPEDDAAAPPLPHRNLRTAESSAQFWRESAHSWLQAKRESFAHMGVARNAIMFLGDGLSVPTLAAARALKGQRAGTTGEEQALSFEKFPTVGLAKTYCVNAQIADSACTATAYLCGVKTNRGVLGLTADVPRNDCEASLDTSTHLDSIAAWALQDGRDVGIVTTTRITHASPAGAYARIATRSWENNAEVEAAGVDAQLCPDIAHQLVHQYPARDFKVILGGGRRGFRPTTTVDEQGSRGRRTDGRDLIQEWQQEQQLKNLSHVYVWNREQLAAAAEKEDTERLLGLFASTHLKYQLEHTEDEEEPTIAQMTEAALKVLQRNTKGYFLFVEGGRIDHAHHATTPELALDETIRLDEAVQVALNMTSEDDTLIVLTADHAHVMAYNGYSLRGNDILGTSNSLDSSRVPYMTLSYTNGPGFRPHQDGVRSDVTQEDNFRGSPRWTSHVDVPLASETHGGDDVAVFAIGPHHHLFTGLYEQSHLPHLMAYAACFGRAPSACDHPSASASHYPHLLMLISAILIALRPHS